MEKRIKQQDQVVEVEWWSLEVDPIQKKKKKKIGKKEIKKEIKKLNHEFLRAFWRDGNLK